MIKLSSRGPVLYSDRAHRARRAAVPRCSSSARWSRARPRSRTRSRSENEASGALFKIRDDPRVTAIGRVLRRHSIDEVPNVANVLRGEMSLSARARCRSATTSCSSRGTGAATTSSRA